jgi:hypothetical protein
VCSSDLGEIFKGLKYYLSSDLTFTKVNRKIEPNETGGLKIENGNSIQTTTIPKTTIGEFVSYDFNTVNGEYLKIKYDDNMMHFVRNTQTNRFDFYAMEESCTFISPRPYLRIYVDQKGAALLQTGVELQKRQSWGSGLSGSDQLPVLIMEGGKLSRDAVVSYIISKGSAMNRQEINALVSLYFMEAQAEGVNHDIAIAQMCYATKFLTNRKLLDTRNYGGLNTDLGISVKYGGSHRNMEEGVRAHIQHLKGYASCELFKEKVDQRYDLLVKSGKLGTVQTLDGLFTAWAPGNPRIYGDEIKKILTELYQFSGRLI